VNKLIDVEKARAGIPDDHQGFGWLKNECFSPIGGSARSYVLLSICCEAGVSEFPCSGRFCEPVAQQISQNHNARK
jgi:hypothetical protein